MDRDHRSQARRSPNVERRPAGRVVKRREEHRMPDAAGSQGNNPDDRTPRDRSEEPREVPPPVSAAGSAAVSDETGATTRPVVAPRREPRADAAASSERRGSTPSAPIPTSTPMISTAADDHAPDDDSDGRLGRPCAGRRFNGRLGRRRDGPSAPADRASPGRGRHVRLGPHREGRRSLARIRPSVGRGNLSAASRRAPRHHARPDGDGHRHGHLRGQRAAPRGRRARGAGGRERDAAGGRAAES